MFDTNIVVVGNVLAVPECRRIPTSGQLVANFRIASTARRFDRENNQWVDGNNLRLRVTAWRRLAESVASSVAVGDPVIVYGRLYTRNWQDDEGNKRISYEMEASSIGHDLARGRSQFFRAKPSLDPVEGQGDELFVDGEACEPVGAPIRYDEGLPDQAPAEAPTFEEVTAELADSDDEELAAEVEELAAASPAPARRSRRTKREPVAA